MNWNALREESESLCHALAGRDLFPHPAYVILRGELPPDRSELACLGFTSESLDVLYRDVIGPRWRGRGFCCVVDETKCRCPEDFFAIVLHELSHALADRYDWSDPQPVDAAALAVQAVKTADWSCDPKQTTPHASFPFLYHELPFLRVAAHLAFRARLIGVNVGMFHMVPTRMYGLSFAPKYEDAIDDEPDLFVDCSFRAILAVPPPPTFRALYESDLERHGVGLMTA